MNTIQLRTVTEKWHKGFVEGIEKGNPREIANDKYMEYIREDRGSEVFIWHGLGNSSSQLQTVRACFHYFLKILYTSGLVNLDEIVINNIITNKHCNNKLC